MKTDNLELTKELLEHLYLEEKLTEVEIAERFGTYQLKVNRLRVKYGIPTILKSDRLDLPSELTREQKQLLLGSMLGDGHLFSTGEHTAAYSEFHCEDQIDYLMWKAEKWGKFVCSIRPGIKEENGKVYRGNTLRLHGCRHFRHYWEMFYPTGKGDKVFTRFPVSQVSGFVLAVWFMDDGSKTPSGYLSFSVSPLPENQEVLLRILTQSGVEGKLYFSENDAGIVVHNRTSMTKLLGLISSYVVPSMNYKLELSPKALGEAPRDRLKSVELASLVDRKLTVTELSKIFNVSSQSVRRALLKSNLKAAKRPSTSMLSIEEATQIIRGIPKASEDLGSTVLEVLLRTEYPERTFEKVKLERNWHLLQESQTRVDGDKVIGMPIAGINLCDNFFEYRFDATYKDNISIRRAWHNSDYLRKAINYQVSHGDPLLPLSVYRALKCIVRTPSNFRPGVAKAVVEAFCPEGGLVLDPCAGYGGRATGTLASGRSYIGVDPHPLAKKAYRRLFDFLGATTKAAICHYPFEDADLGDLQADLVFTSPPYFSAERYSDDPSQSWVRYLTWDQWRDGFLYRLLEKSIAHVTPGGAICINISDVKIKKSVIPLVQTTIDWATGLGLTHESTILMPLGRFSRQGKFEPILVFRKSGLRGGIHGIPESVGIRLETTSHLEKKPKERQYYETSVEGLTEDTLRQLYSVDLFTDMEIGEKFGVSDVLISQRRSFHGIPSMTFRQRKERKSGGVCLGDLTQEQLLALFSTNSDSQVGEKFGFSKTFIRHYRRSKGLAVFQKPPKEPQKPSKIESLCILDSPSIKLPQANLESVLPEPISERVCEGCGITFTSRRKFHDEACRAKYKRQLDREKNPPSGIRIFTCKTCSEKWETQNLGHFANCPSCKEKKEIEPRRKICEYRNCKGDFTDTTPKNGMVYCCDEHRRREKMFRSGKATDVSYFRSERDLGVNSCIVCKDTFRQEEGKRSTRCQPCKNKARVKTCRKCSEKYTDDSENNTRRFCYLCNSSPV